jgi:hypothetical protein
VAELQGASLRRAQLQGASLVGAQLQGAHGTPNVDLTRLWNIDATTRLSQEKLEERANSIPRPQRDSFLLDLASPKEDVLDQNFWDNAHSSQLQGEEGQRKRAEFLANLACSSRDSYVARGLLRNFRFDVGVVQLRQLLADRLLKAKSDPTACPGVNGFTDEDWADVSKLSPDPLMSR